MTLTLVLGGARSGKSGHAQAEAEAFTAGSAARLVMVATGQAFDDEMSERIARHRSERGPEWSTVEAPLRLAETLTDRTADEAVVVDCLTLWLSNLMLAEADLGAAIEGVERALRACPARVWLVSNEVGQGIVPDNALARAFRDEAGRLNQRMARLCDEAVMVVAGLPLRLK